MKRKRYDVLVAEDEAIIALEIKHLLLRNNYNVVGIVKRGEDLIKESEEKKPDLIVSDINLRGNLNGIEAINIIHKSHNTPVVFITGYGDDFTYSNAMAASPCTLIKKPFTELKLIESLRDILNN